MSTRSVHQLVVSAGSVSVGTAKTPHTTYNAMGFSLSKFINSRLGCRVFFHGFSTMHFDHQILLHFRFGWTKKISNSPSTSTCDSSTMAGWFFRCWRALANSRPNPVKIKSRHSLVFVA